jgi:hypothetical protein
LRKNVLNINKGQENTWLALQQQSKHLHKGKHYVKGLDKTWGPAAACFIAHKG